MSIWPRSLRRLSPASPASMQWRGYCGAYRALVSNPGSPARIASFRLATRTLHVGAARWTSMAWPRCGLGLGGKGRWVPGGRGNSPIGCDRCAFIFRGPGWKSLPGPSAGRLLLGRPDRPSDGRACRSRSPKPAAAGTAGGYGQPPSSRPNPPPDRPARSPRRLVGRAIAPRPSPEQSVNGRRRFGIDWKLARRASESSADSETVPVPSFSTARQNPKQYDSCDHPYPLRNPSKHAEARVLGWSRAGRNWLRRLLSCDRSRRGWSRAGRNWLRRLLSCDRSRRGISCYPL